MVNSNKFQQELISSALTRMPALRSLLLVAATALFSVPTIQAQVRLVGSDLIRPSLDALSARGTGGVRFEAQLAGTQPALASLRAGEADAAIVLLAPTIQPDFTGLRRAPLAFQAAVFVVSEGNPVTSLNSSQLRGIFGADESIRINRWGEVGATGEWTNRAINVRSVAPRTTLAFDFFRNTVLATPRMRSGLQTDDSVEALFRALLQDTSSIGLSPVSPPSGSGLRSLAIAAAPGEAAFPPSLENINVGDYKHRMPLEIVYTAERRDSLKPLLLILYTDEFAADLVASGLTPLPQQLRRQLIADLNR
jgi:ABC-type phosphate transport system substrate-binding protein